MIKKITLAIFWFFLFSPWALAEEYKFDLSEIEKKPYHLGGYGEFRPALSGSDRQAALYKLRFYNRDEGSVIPEYNARVQLEGSYERDIWRFFIRPNADLSYSYPGWTGKTTLYEGFLSLKPANALTVETGKKTLKWGKGYAWNPVAFLDRIKDPNDPELALEGFIMASADYIRSFSGPLKTLSFTPVIIPVYENINDDFGQKNKLNAAGKIYLLLYDTDIDFIFLTGGSKPPAYGLDFSRNITSNFEMHGELAYINDFKGRIIDGNGNIFLSDHDVTSYLIGLRYLTKKDTTYILEYYRNGTGFTKEEMEDYFSFINQGYDNFLASGNDASLKKALAVTEGNYGRVNPMKHYLYLRISQKEPFDILYFTPAVAGIWNLDDRSFSLSPELLYTGVTNLELMLKAIVLNGQRESEFGEKQNDYRLEFRVRYYF